MSIEFGSYLLKTAESVEELVESFKLRHDVFFREFQGVEKAGVDVDKFDCDFDHLLIIHRETQQIIGTYRLSCMPSPAESYTALEFDLARIFALEGPHLELGRACIHKAHRRGAVISLLWRGIAEYMNRSGANVLFGCSSLKLNNARDAALVFKHLSEQGAMLSTDLASATRPFQMADFDQWLSYFHQPLTEEQKAEAEEAVPSLLKSYLKLGAKIAAEPAFDRDFDCVDLLTVLKKEDLANSLARRFQVQR